MPLIPMAQIEPDPENVRRVAASDDAAASLKASMAAVGLIQPLIVRPVGVLAADRYAIIAGHRRFAAAMALGWTEIDCIVRTPGTDDIPLLQLVENTVRADMAPIDVWAAVERLATEGMPDPAIAVSLNLAERRVAQLRAMGRLHPTIQAYIRETGNMPPDHNLAVIVQAPQEKQAEAAKQLKAGWHMVATACKVSSVDAAALPPAVVAAYDGLEDHDLFGDERNRKFLDLPKVDRLLNEHARQIVEEARQMGFVPGEAKPAQYGDVKAPPGCEAHGWREWRPDAGKKTKKADRALFCVTATVMPGFKIEARIWHLKQKKPKAKPGEAPAAGASAAAERPALVTKKGAERIDELKREAAADAASGPAGSIEKQHVAMALMLRSCLPWQASENIPDKPLAEDGSLLIGTDATREFCDAVLKQALLHLGSRFGEMQNVQRIGHLFGGTVLLPTDDDTLALLKRPGLAGALKAIGEDPESQSSQRALRAVIRKKLDHLDVGHLAELGWKLAPPPVAGSGFSTDGEEDDQGEVPDDVDEAA